jgi:hypothetical protein
MKGLNQNFEMLGFHDAAASFQLPTSPATPKNNRRTVKENNVYVGMGWFWRDEKRM